MSNRRTPMQPSGAAAPVATASGPCQPAAVQAPPAPVGLIVHRAQPLNAEPPPARLRAAFITPQPDFYIRSHGPVPRLARDGYKLRIGRAGATAMELPLNELQSRFPRRTVTAVLQCAGNRRADMLAVKPVPGDPWGPGAIGNATWGGVSLGDVLRAAGVAAEVNEDQAQHVAFDSHDEIEDEGEHLRFGVSIPLAKAMAPGTLLAFTMNGEPLTAEHGFPVRVVTPGYAGVRSPKWLAAITVQDTPSDNPMQQKEYKLFPPDVTKATADMGKGQVINDMPLTSAICEPAADARIPAGVAIVRGYAVATARAVVRVDVSGDGGATWRQANLERHDDLAWSWTFWSIRLDLPAGRHELVVRAWDDAGGTQPGVTGDIWNYPGYLSAAWHRVPILAG